MIRRPPIARLSRYEICDIPKLLFNEATEVKTENDYDDGVVLVLICATLKLLSNAKNDNTRLCNKYEQDVQHQIMRLAKYGNRIRENYKAFKNKDRTTVAEPVTVPTESVRSRVAMDFTGKEGRVVEDPVEANEIALAEGYMWKRRHKLIIRRPCGPKSGNEPQQVDSGVHTLQPWYHANLTRDQASSLVTRYGNGDGVFIVRPSRTSEGTFVLTYKCQGKLFHQQIIPVKERERNIVLFSADNGSTKFYDILQLIEFYTVNQGALACRLTHYVTENANLQQQNPTTATMRPSAVEPQQQRYASVAVNTDITIVRGAEGVAETARLLESPSGSSSISKTTSSRSSSSRCSTPRDE